MIAVILRGVALTVVLACGLAQFALYWAILANHKPSASRAWFFLVKWPRDEDLTPDGVIYARWWRRTAAASLLAILVIMAARALS